LLPFALTVLLVAGPGPFHLRADDPPADGSNPITTSASPHYPEVTCTTSDTLACADTLQMAADARLQLTPLLKLGPNWRFPVHIRVMAPGDPVLAKINRQAAAVFADGNGMHIEAVVPSNDPDARLFIQRQFVTALLWEKFFANTQTFDGHTALTVVPTWLVEGLSQWLNDDPEHNRESIVRKAVAESRAPTLIEIASWNQISKDRLMGFWQGSFCFYLVDSIIPPGPKRDDFQQWLATLAGPNPASAQRLFPTEAGWQRELVEAMQRSRDIVYTWDETQSDFATAEVVQLPIKKGSDPKVCTLDTVLKYPYDDKMAAILQQKLTDLTALELRAHPSWHQILELYRSGLSTLINLHSPEEAQKLFAQAHDLKTAELADHQKLVDYVNWFEVTRDYPGTPSRFSSYFKTAQDLEQVQADPTHPNLIREHLLSLETGL
jgi:hypothetical protein